MTNDDILNLIIRREQQMVIHSCLYYKFNKTVWTDKEFDAAALELRDLIRKYPEIAQKTRYHDAFKNWDGTTGFDLPINDANVIIRASHILEGDNDICNQVNQQDIIQVDKKEQLPKNLEQKHKVIQAPRCSKKAIVQTKLF